jgi:hypothetical protein
MPPFMGIGCQVLETADALTQALVEYRQKDLILIDTPGLCGSEMEASEDLARVLVTHPGIDTHLVLPASMRASDLRRISEQYSVFQPSKLLFTRLDETETIWSHFGKQHSDEKTGFLLFARPAHSGGSGAGDGGSPARFDSEIAGRRRFEI